MNRFILVACFLFCLVAGPAWGTQSYIGVNEGTDAKVATETRTQGSDTVEDEVTVSTLGTWSLKEEAQITVTGTSAAIFGGATNCHAFIVKADPANGGPVFLRRQAGVTTSNGFRLDKGDVFVFAAPNTKDCADVYVIEGAGCSACKLYVATN